MPGDTPHEAVTQFLSPLRSALSVLAGRGVIAVPRHGKLVKYRSVSWILNSGEGMRLGEVGTLGYNYRLELPNGKDKWRMHWHPDGLSDMHDPHLHTPPDLKVHRPCDRMTFETAIRWCLEDGAPLTCGVREAEDLLTEAEAPHRLHRSWSSALDRPTQRCP